MQALARSAAARRGPPAAPRRLRTRARAKSSSASATDRRDTAEGGAPRRSSDRAPLPTRDGIERRSAQCYGCGVRVQLDEPSAPGFVDRETYERRRKHHQLDQLLCARCCELSHGAMVNAVEGQGLADRRGRGLVSQDELVAELKQLRDKRVLVLLLLDLTDLSGTMLGRVRDAIGRNPVIAVGTKFDLLPKGTSQAAVREWLQDELERKRLTVAGTFTVAARSRNRDQSGVSGVAGATLRERSGRDVYIVGASNVGKSTFCRALLGALRDRGDFLAQDSKLPVASPMPGTTLGAIKLQAFTPKSALYDTPGVVLSHRINTLLDGDDVAALTPRKRMRALIVSAARLQAAAAATTRAPPYEYAGALDAPTFGASLEGLSVTWGALARVDVLSAPPDFAMSFVGPSQLSLSVVCTPVAAERAEGEGDEAAWMPPSAAGSPGAALVEASGGLHVAREVELEVPAGGRAHAADLAVSGLSAWVVLTAGGAVDEGWASRFGRVQLRVWAPRGVGVFLRPAMPVSDPYDAS